MAESEKIETLEIILKITERCNINCSYCYYFNGGNSDFADKPVYIAASTVESVTRFLCDAIRTHQVKNVQIDLHGGEPLMLKKERFREMVKKFREEIGSLVNLRIALQTNAILVDDQWVDIIEEFQISAAVSIDGTKADNDTFRLDHKGQGTYDATVAGLRKLQAAAQAGRIYEPGIICVVNPEFDGARTYRHFVDELGIRQIHFSPLDYSRDNVPQDCEAGARNFFAGALQEWLKDSNPNVTVRIFQSLLGKLVTMPGPQATGLHRYTVLTIRADGEVSGPDDLRNALPKAFELGMNVATHSLWDYLSHPLIDKVIRGIAALPESCSSCGFARACEAGKAFSAATNRYSLAGGFNNRSLYCKSYTDSLLTLCNYAMKRGVSWEKIEMALAAPQEVKEAEVAEVA